MLFLRITFLTFLSLICNDCFSMALQENCTEQEAIAADKEASEVTDWKMMLRSFLRYNKCDDASIAEGYSESVSRLLADDWHKTPSLIALIRKNKGFGDFILKHIDETIPLHRLRKITFQAKHECPRGGESFCMAVLKASR